MLFSGDLHVLLLPDAMHPLVVDLPALRNEFLMHAGTAKMGTSLGDTSHFSQQAPFIGTLPRAVALGATWLTQHPAGPAFGDFLRPQTATHFLHGPSSTFGAYQFPWEASLRISISRACSATSFFNRAFSFWRAFSCLAISGCIPPYF